MGGYHSNMREYCFERLDGFCCKKSICQWRRSEEDEVKDGDEPRKDPVEKSKQKQQKKQTSDKKQKQEKKPAKPKEKKIVDE